MVLALKTLHCYNRYPIMLIQLQGVLTQRHRMKLTPINRLSVSRAAWLRAVDGMQLM